MSTDQNLLFGVLALQADLIGPARFAEACSAWAGRKETPLAELLVERGWLTPQDRADLDRLVQRKLDKHQGDARAGLAEVTTDAVRCSLASIADADVQQSVVDLPTHPFAVTGSTTAHQPEGRGRYTLTRLHAQGGIGQVWLARDGDLGRDVALKELRPERNTHATSQARFLEEARITGQLEHPGIVPVHELVRGENGQPFYTMRMVHGRTLTEAIKEYHQKHTAGSVGSLELRGLLGAFVAVCNAVAYAHSRGVLHRDLKPQNVVLGDYGEVIVLDWGLAKLLELKEEKEEASSLLPVSVEFGSRDETMQGQVLGTPAYMAPEQAEGRLDLLGPGTDVYGLGAVLYEILTGQPPFSGSSTHEMLRRVVRETPTHPRQRLSGTPPALEAVCLKALAKKPAQRYGTAVELAKEVERWLADEPVEAWREPLPIRVGRWVRRHQSLVAGLTAATGMLLVLGTAGAMWLGRERERLRTATESALQRVSALQLEARWAEARALLDQTEARVGESGPADLRHLLDQARADLDLVALLDTIRLGRAELKGGRFDLAGMDDRYVKAFARAGLAEPGDDEVVVARLVADSNIHEALVAALDDWAFAARQDDRRAWLMSVARRADPHPWRDRFRDPALWHNEQKLAQLAKQVPRSELTLPLVWALGWRLQKRAEGEALLREALQEHPDDFWLNFSLAYCLKERGKLQEVEGYCRAALALRPTSSIVWYNMGVLLESQGKEAEAQKFYQRSIVVDPTYSAPHNNLGWLLWKQGKVVEAERLYLRAIELDSSNASAVNNLGRAMAEKGDTAEAERLFRRAIDLDPQYAMAHNNLAAILHLQGRKAAAEKYCRRAVYLDPNLATAHTNLAWIFHQQGKAAEALREYWRAIELDPKDSNTHNKFGTLLGRQGKLLEAEKQFDRAIKVNPNDALAHTNLGVIREQFGKSADAERLHLRAIELDPKVALAYTNLGSVYQHRRRWVQAEKWHRKALEIDSRLALAHANLGWVLQQQDKSPEAEIQDRMAIQLDPNGAEGHNNLGVLLAQQGNWAEAEKEILRAIEVEPAHAMARNNLGLVRMHQGRWHDAEQLFRRAIELHPGNALVRINLGTVQSRQGKWAEAVRSYRKALDVDPTDAVALDRLAFAQRLVTLEPKLRGLLKGDYRPRNDQERLRFALLCQSRQLYHIAAELYAGALAANPRLNDDPKMEWRYNAACCAALSGCGMGEDAGKLDDREKVRLRSQALTWLQADLALWNKQAQSANPADRAAAGASMRHWQDDSDLAGVRGKVALDKLPEAEREPWSKLWADVAMLLDKTRGK